MKTPYIIFKPRKLRENYKIFEKLCKKNLKDFIIAYSIKTNSFEGVIQTLEKEGSNFEVASLNEIAITPKKSKIFNGCCKTKEELEIAIKQKCLINIDSKEELKKISQITRSNSFNIGLRVSMNESKFGIEEKEIPKIIKYADSLNLKIIGLHFHCGTQLNFRAFEQNIKKASEIAEKLNSVLDLKYIDIGGGFPDKIQLKNLNTTLEAYIEIIKNYFWKFNSTIILEPGRYLVADAFELTTKVNTIKEKNNKTYAILDAGINILPKITLSTYKFSKLNQTFKPSKEPKHDYILAGPLLFANDALGRYVGNLQEEDLIKIENVGAYCYNLAWTISYDKPKIYIE